MSELFEKSTELQEYPTPDQLFEIASVGVCHAKRYGKLIKSPKNNRTHIFLADEIYTADIIGEMEFYESTQKFIGSICRAGYQKWSMRIVSPFWVRASGLQNQEEATEDGYRLSYIFEWGSSKVYTSERHMHTHNKLDTPLTEIMPGDLMSLIDQPDFLNCIGEFSRVSSGDCNRLLQDMRTFTSIV